jgi:hypothetical protein
VYHENAAVIVGLAESAWLFSVVLSSLRVPLCHTSHAIFEREDDDNCDVVCAVESWWLLNEVCIHTVKLQNRPDTDSLQVYDIFSCSAFDQA